MRYDIIDNYLESLRQMECSATNSGAMRLAGESSFAGKASGCEVLDLGIANKIRRCFGLPVSD